MVTDKTEVRDDFPQFGGSVKMKYSFDIPIFNLEEIISGDGKPVFDLVTVGRLASSSDESFWDFEGFPSPLADKKRNFDRVFRNFCVTFDYRLFDCAVAVIRLSDNSNGKNLRYAAGGHAGV